MSQKEPCVFYMKKSSKYWLWGSVCIFFIILIAFIFHNYVHETVLLWVVILTPITCLILYPLTCLLDEDGMSRNENGS